MELDVVFRNEKHQKLIGTLSSPTVPPGHFYPAVILCHGFNAHKESFFFPELTDALVKNGIAVLRFDCRGCGKSEGDYHATYLDMKKDILAAINYLSKNEDIEYIGVAGHSMGGTACILAGSADKNSHAVATFGAVVDVASSVQEKKEHATKKEDCYVFKGKYGDCSLNQEFFSEAKGIDVLRAVSHLNKPLLVVHGTKDSRVALEQGIQLFLHASVPKSIKRIGGSDHGFKGYHKQLIESTISFFKQHLLEKDE